MIVILEGVDGSGKTTLYNELKNMGYPTLAINTSAEDEPAAWRDAKKMFKDDIGISDRSFLTDIAYRLQDMKPRKGMDLHHISSTLKNEVKVIFLTSGTEYEDSMQRGEDNILTREDSDEIKSNYEMIANLLELFTDVPIMRYNWRSHRLLDVIKFIERRE